MRKVKAFLFAAAAMTMTFVSCNKEESVETNAIHVTFEQNEVMDGVKSHLVFDSENGGNFIPVWDNGDRVTVNDNDGRSAQYIVHIENGEMYLTHSYDHYAGGAQFNPQSDFFYCAFPEILKGRSSVQLPNYQVTTDGTVHDFPMYAQGNLDEFAFKNICSLIRLHLTGVSALDSISITTEKYINGLFNVDFNLNPSYPLTSNTEENMYGASKTTTLRFTEPFQLSGTERIAELYIPAGDYKLFTITFYANNGQRYVVRKTNGLNINRTTYADFTLPLTSVTFKNFVEGSTNKLFNLNEDGTQKCYIAKTNAQFVGIPGYWRLADNGFDCFGSYQISKKNVNNVQPISHDRDLFCWGANTYKNSNGGMVHNNSNGVHIYPDGSAGARVWYALQSNVELTGDNDWANNGFVNISGDWVTPSADQMNAILANNTTFMTTISDLGVTGLVIIPGNNTTLAQPSSMTANDWRSYEIAGAAFLPVMYTHNTSGNSVVSGQSYYWTRTSDNNDNAMALSLTNTTYTVGSFNKKVGGYVRLIKVVNNVVE